MASNARQAVSKLFVGNIPWTIGSRELRKYFSEFGHVASAIVVFDRNTGVSRGYGFVLFSNPKDIVAVKNHTNHTLEGSVLSIDSASGNN